jgi:hypothetical protein
MPYFLLAILAMKKARVNNTIPEKRKKLGPSAIIGSFVTVAKKEKLSKMASYIGFTNLSDVEQHE